MSNTGKLLEAFVAQIERLLLPQGLAVTVNDKIFNDEGVQIAEFDIEIEGKVGTTKLKWLIECRDRPSEGSAPGSWIEQLVGRRRIFGFNKIIAVSTTGFAPAAIENAEKAGIEIRTVTQSNVGDIKDWFLVDKITLFKQHADLVRVKLLIAKEESNEVREALKKQLAPKGNLPILLSTETNQAITAPAAFLAAINTIGSLYDDLVPKGGSKKLRLLAKYPRDDSHYVVDTDVERVRIREILFKGEISVTLEKVPIAAVKKYQNISSGENIATTASFNFDVDGRQLEVSFNKLAGTGETHILMRASKLSK